MCFSRKGLKGTDPMARQSKHLNALAETLEKLQWTEQLPGKIGMGYDRCFLCILGLSQPIN